MCAIHHSGSVEQFSDVLTQADQGKSSLAQSDDSA